MEDKTRDKRTGLTVEVRADFKIPGDNAHKVDHLRRINADYTRLLGAALSNPSDIVACVALSIAGSAVKAALRVARMDEDEFREELEKILIDIQEAISRHLHEQEPHGFSQN
jgi:hypothetical protein